MALVQGEDTESDEEINTDQLQHLQLTPDGSLRGFPKLTQQGETRSKAGIVAGEESETDEEEEEGDETDGGGQRVSGKASGEAQDQVVILPPSQTGSARSGVGGGGRKASEDSTSSAPQSLLHKKLRESNLSLRKNIVERILKLYYTTCRNLNMVIENLNKAQLTIEKVNAHLKRSDNELTQLNTTMDSINQEAKLLAPNIKIVVPPPAVKKKVASSPLRLRQQKTGPPPTSFTNTAHDFTTGSAKAAAETSDQS